MSGNKLNVTKGGRVQKTRIQPAVISTILTPKRKWMIVGFKSIWIRSQRNNSLAALEAGMKAPEWRTVLFQHLASQDDEITREDIRRWIEKHNWITIPNALPKGFPSIESVNEIINDAINSRVPGEPINYQFKSTR